MTLVVVLIETLLLTWVAWRIGRASPGIKPPYGKRLIAIAALLTAQTLVLFLFAFQLLPAAWGDRSGTLYGLAWLTQAARVALLLPAFGLWIGMVRPEMTTRGHWVGLVAGVAMLGWIGGTSPFLGFLLLAVILGRLAWPSELTGWRRAVALVISPLLLLLLSVIPANPTGGDGGIVTRIVAASNVWPPPLVLGTVPPWVRLELDLARPLDRVVQTLVDLFRIQLLVLTMRMLTLPIRLSGTSLKRRFMLNYVLVRQIPGILGTILLAVVGYLAFGVLKAAQVRGEFERTLARGTATGTALLADARVARGGADVATRLAAAREWLGADGARAHILVRSWDARAATDTTRDRADTTRAAADTASADSLLPPAPVLASTPGADTLAEVRFPRTPDGRLEGMIEAGGGLYLASRSTADSPAPGRAVDVFVPVDSIYLGQLARRVGARIQLRLAPGVSVALQGISFESDKSDTSGGPQQVRVGSGNVGLGTSRRTFFLARSFVPYGDWRSGWREGTRGAVALELGTTRGLVLRTLRDIPGWLFSNIVVVALILGLLWLVGMTEGLAVRSGRTIVQSIEEEVAQLREAAARFGAGDLTHRVPVKGRDELSALAGSFNEMAANLERQRVELIEKERIEEDLEVARQIQKRFLPQHAPSVRGLEVAGVSKPSREVGGDLFYYVELRGDRLAMALGDVSGKSVPAALLMSNVMSTLRAEVQHEAEIEKSLERINRLIVDQIEPGRFVTLFYGVAEPGEERLRYTSAGHNPALKLSAAGEASWLNEGGVPLGVMPEAVYPSAETPFQKGDLVVVYSDGVTEAEGPDRGGQPELFGEQRLLEAVRRVRDQGSEGIVSGILDAVERFAAGKPQADDITLVVVRRI